MQNAIEEFYKSIPSALDAKRKGKRERDRDKREQQVKQEQQVEHDPGKECFAPLNKFNEQKLMGAIGRLEKRAKDVYDQEDTIVQNFSHFIEQFYSFVGIEEKLDSGGPAPQPNIVELDSEAVSD